MPGHVFAGWNTQPDGSGTAIGGGARIAVIGNVTLYAMWRPDFRTVAYRNTGATFGTPPPTLTAMRDSYVTVSGNTGSLQRTGALFAGWSTQQNSRGTQFQPGQTTRLSANLTLHPMWVNNTFTVAYNANGGSGTVPASHAFAGGTYVRIAENTGNLQRDGYVFAGWNTAQDGLGANFAVGASTILERNTTLFARWMPIRVQVIFNGNGATGGSAPPYQTIVGNGSITMPQHDLSRAGYRFLGWHTERDAGYAAFRAGNTVRLRDITQSTVAEQVITLYAQWERTEVAVTVHFRANGAPGNPPASITITGDDTVTLPGMTKPGHWLVAWTTEPISVYPAFSPLREVGVSDMARYLAVMYQEITLYAQWIPYRIVTAHNGNGNTGGSVPPHQLIEGLGIVVLQRGTIFRAGYEFVGWNTQPDGLGTMFHTGRHIGYTDVFRYVVEIRTTVGDVEVNEHRVTLYAMWRRLDGITLYYEVHNQPSVPLDLTFEIMDTVKLAFIYEFEINFVRTAGRMMDGLSKKPGCTSRYDPRDGYYRCHIDYCSPRDENGVPLISREICVTHHHKSGEYFLNVNRDNSARVFRFVDFRLCFYDPPGDGRGGRGHIEILGLAHLTGGPYVGHNAIMTTRATNLLWITAHELSHNLGAQDNFYPYFCTPGQLCTLRNDLPLVHNRWCSICRNHILENRHRHPEMS